MLDDTITAIATPLGQGGISIVKVCGKAAIEVVDRCFRTSSGKGANLIRVRSHTIHYGQVVRNGEKVDEVLVAVMRAPRTYTREDTVEINCHGGMIVTRSVLETLLANGARLAQPGEFTRRAFVNGRIDLAQAEAVADVIQARTGLALKVATEQLEGKLSRKTEALRENLMGILAHIEAHIDFPDEDIEPDTRTALLSRMERLKIALETILRTAHEGQLLRQGVRAAIVGRPNAGKSSLLNQLLGHERAIVSPIAGTTRDTIEETADIRGIPIRFVDTAGLRESADWVEKEGVRRSLAMAHRAELVLHVIDQTLAPSVEDHELTQALRGKPRIIVVNKIDQQVQLSSPSETNAPIVRISCTTGEGIEELKSAIHRLVWMGVVEGSNLETMINARHKNALERSLDSLQRGHLALAADAGLELVAMELRMAASAIGEIVGKTTTEDLLDVVFSQFCIGK